MGRMPQTLKEYYKQVVDLNQSNKGWDQYYYGVYSKIINENNYEYTAEIGAGYGTHSKQVLASCPSIKKHIIIDPMMYYSNDAFVNDIQATVSETPDNHFNELYELINNQLSEYSSKYTWLRKPSQQVTSEEIPDESLDCIFVDGDHSFDAVYNDLLVYWPKVRSGGQLLGDDYWMDSVKGAVEKFSNTVGTSFDFLTKPNNEYKIYRFFKP